MKNITSSASARRQASWLAAALLTFSLAGCEVFTGEEGEPGPSGPRGPVGDEGDPGDRGPKGEPGEDGTPAGDLPSAAPRIRAVRPDVASARTLVTIEGKGFSPDVGGNQVLVDGRPVEVVSAAADHLVVRGIAPPLSPSFFEPAEAMLSVVTEAGRSNAHLVTMVYQGWTRPWPTAVPTNFLRAVTTRDGSEERIWLVDENEGIFHLDRGTKTVRQVLSHDEIGTPTAVAGDASDRFLIATSHAGGSLVEVRGGSASIVGAHPIFAVLTAMAIAPDGELFLATEFGIYRASLVGPLLVEPFLLQDERVIDLAVSDDAVFTIRASEGGRIQVYRRSDGTEETPLFVGNGEDGTLLLDGDLLHFATYDEVHVVDLETGESTVQPVEFVDEATPDDLLLLEDGTFLVVGAQAVVATDLQDAWEFLAVGVDCVYAGVAIGEEIFVGEYEHGAIVRIGVDGAVQYVARLGFSVDDLWVDSEGFLLVSGYADGVHRVDPASGAITELVEGETEESESWTAGGVTEDGEGTVYFSFEYTDEDEGARLVGIGAVDLTGGESRLVAEMEGGDLYSLIYADDRLYYLGPGGRLWSLDPKSPADSLQQESGAFLEDLYGTALTPDGALLLSSPRMGLFEYGPDRRFFRLLASEAGLQGLSSPSAFTFSTDGVVALPSGDAAVLSCNGGLTAVLSR